MTSQLYYQKGILYERARGHSWSGVRGQAKKHVIPCCCFKGEEIHFKLHIFIFTKKGHPNMLHNNMHILTVLQCSLSSRSLMSVLKKMLFPYRELHRGCTHIYNDCSSDKRECKWIAELFCLEEHLYIFVHKRLSPTVKKVNKRFIPPTDSWYYIDVYSFRERKFTKW